MTTPDYPRRRAQSRRRPWVREVPEAFRVPDVPESVAGAPAPVAGGAAEETVSGSSSDQVVDVAVDLRGRLQHLRIDPRALRGPHPQRVGGAVVEAMADARGRALRLARERARR